MALSIQETAEKFGISPYTLRYYENEGLIPKVHRNASGHRIYENEDLDWIGFVTCLKSTGMPIAEIKRYIKLCEEGDSTVLDRKQLLVAHKNRLLTRMQKLHESLKRIEWKIEHYEIIEKEIKR
jgi:DNA-binding transcriptional MerR regulator